MNKTQKILIIFSWFFLVSIFVLLFDEIIGQTFPNLSEETRSFITFLSAIALTAFLLDNIIKKILQIKQQRQIKQNLASNSPKTPDDLFVFYLNDWNIYNIKINTNQTPFHFLSQKKVEWILPFTSFKEEEKSQLLKRVKMANQKLYMIQDEPALKPLFQHNIENLFEEKKLDYAVLLKNKESFLQGFPAEQYELLETRDILEILIEILEKLGTKTKRKKLEKDLEFEDKILKTATKEPFTLTIPEIEIKIRPKSFWWWKKAQVEA